MGNGINETNHESLSADDDLVDVLSQAFFACSAAGYDAGNDGDDPTAIAPPERFEIRQGWPPVNRSKFRAFTRQIVTLLADRRAYLAKTHVSRALDDAEPAPPSSSLPHAG